MTSRLLMLLPTFFARAPLVCARDLIGAELVWGRCRGRIVESGGRELADRLEREGFDTFRTAEVAR